MIRDRLRRSGPATSGGSVDDSGTRRNWTGDQTCRPGTLEKPRSAAEIIALLEKAELNGRTVRVAGAGHSFSGVVLTNGMLLSLGPFLRGPALS